MTSPDPLPPPSPPVWPRPVYACIAPGCRFLQPGPYSTGIPSCPAHHTVLVPVLVSPHNATTSRRKSEL